MIVSWLLTTMLVVASARARAADADVDVLHGGRVRGVVGGGALVADLQERGGVDRPGVDEEAGELPTPSTSATFMAVTPLSGMIVARPRPSTMVFARLTLIVWSTW